MKTTVGALLRNAAATVESRESLAAIHRRVADAPNALPPELRDAERRRENFLLATAGRIRRRVRLSLLAEHVPDFTPQPQHEDW